MARAVDADVVIMAAAVSDFTPVQKSDQKIAKGESLQIMLARTRDILADLGQMSSRRDGERPVLVGFAAETHDVLVHAREKLQRKAVDLIVANDVSRRDAGFEVDANAVTLISRDDEQGLPLQSKTAVAGAILDRVERLLTSTTTAVRGA